jgi:hypothetical protein
VLSAFTGALIYDRCHVKIIASMPPQSPIAIAIRIGPAKLVALVPLFLMINPFEKVKKYIEKYLNLLNIIIA